jgi:hypothetical protein
VCVAAGVGAGIGTGSAAVGSKTVDSKNRHEIKDRK